MEIDRSDESVCKKGGGVLFLGVNVVLTCLHAAMLSFHGGNRFSSELNQFKFTENFLSELGSITYWDGSPNIGSRILFDFGIIFAVLCFICYLRHFPGNFLPHTKSHHINLAGNFLA